MASRCLHRSGAATLGFALLGLAGLEGEGASAQQTAESYRYDALSRLITVEVVSGQNQGEVRSYCFDSAGNRSTVSAASNGSVASCVIDGAGSAPPPPPPAPPSFSISSPSPVIEGSPIQFMVAKSGSTTSSFSVNFATANGTATSGLDYVATSGTLVFGPHEVSKHITVSTIDDAHAEPSETVLVNISAATGGATITVAQGVGQINDNDGFINITDQWLNVLSPHQSVYSCYVYDIPELGYFQEVCELVSNGIVIYNSNALPPADPGYYRPPPGMGTPLQVQPAYYGTGVAP